MKKHILVSILALSSVLACTQAPKRPGGPATSNGTGDGNPNGGTGGMTPGEYPNLKCNDDSTFRNVRAWRRLSNIELQNTVSAVFGIKDSDSSGFINDIPKAEIFDTAMIASNYVDTNRLKGYMTFATSLASKVNIATVFPCLSSGGDSGKSCISKTLPELGSQAWRRPLTNNELKDLNSTYSELIADGFTAEASARIVVQALVLSQGFLYRSELGEKLSDGSFELTDWELASALSYAVVRTVPDAELRQLAEEGRLRDESTIRAQAQRLLKTPQAKIAWKDFGSMWLNTQAVLDLKKDETKFTPTVASKLAAEMDNFFVDTMFSSKNRTFQQLMTADYTLGDSSSSFIYDGTVSDGKITFSEPQRRGILGQAAFLSYGAVADGTNPVKRGVYVLTRLMCSGFGSVPPTEIPPNKEGLTTKELFKQHNVGTCANCHSHIDEFGFALENFDQVGRFRDKDGNEAIDIKSLVSIDDKEVTITSPEELGAAIASSDTGRECYVRQTFRYAFGRLDEAPTNVIGANGDTPETTKLGELDSCQIKSVAKTMLDNGGDLQTAIVELVASPAFRLRLATPEK